MHRHVVTVFVMLSVVVILVTTHYSFKVWKLHSKNHCIKKASGGKGHISAKSRKVAQHRCPSREAMPVSTWQASLPVPTAEDVHPCWGHRVEGVQPCHLLGRWEPSAEQDLKAEIPAIELVGPDSTKEDIAETYCDMYQLWRLLGELPCDDETEEVLCQEILDSIKECLWCMGVPTLLGEGLSQYPAGTSWCNPQTNYSARIHATYDRFKNIKWDSCGEALAIVRDAHQQVLAATAPLEDKIERLSCFLSHGHWCSGSCQCSGSHRCSGSCQWSSWTVSYQIQVPKAASCQGESTRR